MKEQPPIIRGVPCTEDKADEFGIFSKWRCPHCHARLSASNETICLNACHLPDSTRARFNRQMKVLSELAKESEDDNKA